MARNDNRRGKLRSRCHPSAPVVARLSAGAIVLDCAECGRLVAEFRLGSGEDTRNATLTEEPDRGA